MDSTLFTKKVNEVAHLLCAGHPREAAARFNRLVAAEPNLNPITLDVSLKTAVFLQVGPKVDKCMTDFRLAREALATVRAA